MRISRFVYGDEESYGAIVGDEIVDLRSLAFLMKHDMPTSIDGLISLGREGETDIDRLVARSTKIQRKKVSCKTKDISIKAPVVSPPKIVCLGLNYRDHAEESGLAAPKDPVIFMKPRTTIISQGEPIIKPKFVNELDYEVELAIIIGKKGKNIPLNNAKDHIFGYTVFNDISARDIQFKDGQWTRGKSFDTFAPTGPCITTAQQIEDPNDLRMWTRVNGETRQNSSTRNMIFDVYEIVKQLSRVMTLEPCDIIATGTPSGVAAFMKPEQKFLNPGDTVEVEIEKIGSLHNKILENE